MQERLLRAATPERSPSISDGLVRQRVRCCELLRRRATCRPWARAGVLVNAIHEVFHADAVDDDGHVVKGAERVREVDSKGARGRVSRLNEADQKPAVADLAKLEEDAIGAPGLHVEPSLGRPS